MYSSMINPTFKSAKLQWEERRKDLVKRLEQTEKSVKAGNQLDQILKSDLEALKQK
ncbi:MULTISPECIES: hypothetical protein [Limnobacter]|uniref:Uncharacterized protein n=1 Tax=Limnobacter litoralis TaxID=481366 RepID=A0ABQ5YV58_9BURK|nr:MULTISPECIES: hypothetical protein [Limnobacter]GLR27336.1 hypothetical protein GCM10007875_24270 [Limnobacter litoralis]HEX5487048.1 hypothetical protein [Limnobacter sp.]